MYVYLYDNTASSLSKNNTSIEMYRESSLSSIESSYLIPTEDDDDISVVEFFFFFSLILFFSFIYKLRKAVVDHVSDTFMTTNVPLLALIDAARHGNIQLVGETAQIFMEHAMKLIEV